MIKCENCGANDYNVQEQAIQCRYCKTVYANPDYFEKLYPTYIKKEPKPKTGALAMTVIIVLSLLITLFLFFKALPLLIGLGIIGVIISFSK